MIADGSTQQANLYWSLEIGIRTEVGERRSEVGDRTSEVGDRTSEVRVRIAKRSRPPYYTPNCTFQYKIASK